MKAPLYAFANAPKRSVRRTGTQIGRPRIIVWHARNRATNDG